MPSPLVAVGWESLVASTLTYWSQLLFPPPLPAREEMWWANRVYHLPGGVLSLAILAWLPRYGVPALRNITCWSLAALVRTAITTLPSFERQYRWLFNVIYEWHSMPRARDGC